MEKELLSKIGLSILLIPVIGTAIWPIVWRVFDDIKNIPPVTEPTQKVNLYLYLIILFLFISLPSSAVIDNKLMIAAWTWLILGGYFIYRGTSLKGGIKSKDMMGRKEEYFGNLFYGAFHTNHHIGIYIILFLLIYMIFKQIFS